MLFSPEVLRLESLLWLFLASSIILAYSCVTPGSAVCHMAFFCVSLIKKFFSNVSNSRALLLITSAMVLFPKRVIFEVLGVKT